MASLVPRLMHEPENEAMCERSMWRLIYSKRKLKPAEKLLLEQALDGLSFSCGAQLQDVNIPEHKNYIVSLLVKCPVSSQ